MSLSFIIYYDDGREFAIFDATSELSRLRHQDDAVNETPGQGVIVVAQSDQDVGRELLHMKDFYCWDHGRWLGMDTYGLYDYLARPGWRKVLAGRTVPYGVYSSIFGRASADDRLPTKSALLVGESPKR